jgi:hypothetical protein
MASVGLVRGERVAADAVVVVEGGKPRPVREIEPELRAVELPPIEGERLFDPETEAPAHC